MRNWPSGAIPSTECTRRRTSSCNSSLNPSRRRWASRSDARKRWKRPGSWASWSDGAESRRSRGSHRSSSSVAGCGYRDSPASSAASWHTSASRPASSADPTTPAPAPPSPEPTSRAPQKATPRGPDSTGCGRDFGRTPPRRRRTAPPIGRAGSPAPPSGPDTRARCSEPSNLPASAAAGGRHRPPTRFESTSTRARWEPLVSSSVSKSWNLWSTFRRKEPKFLRISLSLFLLRRDFSKIQEIFFFPALVFLKKGCYLKKAISPSLILFREREEEICLDFGGGIERSRNLGEMERGGYALRGRVIVKNKIIGWWSDWEKESEKYDGVMGKRLGDFVRTWRPFPFILWRGLGGYFSPDGWVRDDCKHVTLSNVPLLFAARWLLFGAGTLVCVFHHTIY